MNKTKTAVGTAARVAVFAALIGLAAGCHSSPSSSGSSSATTPAGAPASTGAPASAAGFVPIVEPSDPGHPARVRPAPADCYNQPSTDDIVDCLDIKIENTDAAIDAVQQAKYAAASPAGQAAILAQDSAWLNARSPVCNAAFNTGGSIDEISAEACALDESTARLDAVKGIAPPEAMLKLVNTSDPDSWSWYTTPEGSRIAMVPTLSGQNGTGGDQIGGATIRWTIIGGADGFVINPGQFYFSDGSYTNSGVVQPPDPTYHRVGTGQEYSFSIDYTHLSADPGPGGPAAGYVYAPGTPVAVWN